METPIPSPDGRYTVEFSSNEFRMSHWVDEPYVMDTATGQALFHPGSTWHADTVEWSADSRTLQLHMRQYPGTRPHVDVTLDMADQSGQAQHWRIQKAGDPNSWGVTTPDGAVFSGSFAAIMAHLDD